MTAAMSTIKDRYRAVPSAARYAALFVAVFVLWAVGDHVLPRGLPAGLVLKGAVFGALDALVAIGIVLIYKANKVVNFAQAEFGSVAAVLAIEFKLKLHWNYFLAIGAGLVLAIVLGAGIERFIIRRFGRAPRLILAVATIGLAQVLQAFSMLIPLWWSGLSAGTFNTPFNFNFRVFPVAFSGDHLLVLIVVPVVLLGLTWFLKFTDYGVAIRAAAENGDRANLLGVPVSRLSTVVWSISALLSALAVILRVPLLGFSSFTSVSGSGFSLLLRTLAAAVIGGMTSLPVALVASIGFGILSELGAWTFRNGDYIDALLLFVILAVLLVQKEKFSRASETGISTWKAMREVRPIPRELRRLAEVRYGFKAAKWGLIALVLLLPLVLPPSKEQAMGLIFIYSIIAVSLVVLTGWAGNISLGQFAFVGFGAATTGVLMANHGWDMFLAIPVAMLVTAGIALLVGLPALRITGPFLAVTTLAFAVTSGTIFLNHHYMAFLIPDFVPRPMLWQRITWDKDWQMYLVAFAGLWLTISAVQRLRNSRAGRVIIATRDNFQAAQSVSVPTTRMKLAAFAISGAIAGFAGSLYVLHETVFKTDSFGPEVSLQLFSMVVIGGLGSLPGAVLGAVYITVTALLFRGGYALLASGAGMMLLLLILPGGLGELMYRLRDAYLRWVAKRHGLLVPSLVADMRVETEDAPIALGTALEGLSDREAGEVTTPAAMAAEPADDAEREPATAAATNGRANGGRKRTTNGRADSGDKGRAGTQTNGRAKGAANGRSSKARARATASPTTAADDDDMVEIP
ncbi:MAG TPA: ABC transporter permease [Acidimicrobiales bacterium]|nr:ABC transporter permease [Acidimicrobiales bacterium]